MDGFLVDAPPLRPPVWVQQFWGDLTFLHWPVDPATVAHLYPPGTAPDIFSDGLTYVGLVPFVMHRSAVAGGTDSSSWCSTKPSHTGVASRTAIARRSSSRRAAITSSPGPKPDSRDQRVGGSLYATGAPVNTVTPASRATSSVA